MLSLRDYPELLQKGGILYKSFPEFNGGIPILIRNMGQNIYRCANMQCTHARGMIQSPQDNQKVICALHGAEFSIEQNNFGKNIGGQPADPLREFTNTYNEKDAILMINEL